MFVVTFSRYDMIEGFKMNDDLSKQHMILNT